MRRNGQLLPQLHLSIITLAVLLSVLWASPSDGQSTSITSSGLNTTVTPGSIRASGGQNYDITGGTRPGGGTNLFHSFGGFSVGTNDGANFVNDSGLATTNILSRVTGGNVSNIFGEINTTPFPGANLYLINPAGVVFGPTASLNVSGSVKISTADYLRLSDGVRFNAVPGPQDALLSTAPVAAFGFLTDTPRPIKVQGATLQTELHQNDSAKAVSLVGGDIQIAGATLKASGGIDLVSVASRGEIGTEAGAGGLLPAMGRIRLTDTVLDSANSILVDSGGGISTRQAGPIEIRGGQLVIDRSTVTALGATLPGEPPRSGAVTVAVTDTIRAHDSHIESGNAPAVVSLEAGQAIRLNNSTVESNSQKGDVLPGGTVLLRAPTIVLDRSQLNAHGSRTPDQPVGFCCDSPGGSVMVLGDQVRMRNGSNVNVNGEPGGTATINAAETVRLDHSTIEASTTGGARSGTIIISAGEAVRLNHADVSADSVAAAGNIVIEAGKTVASRASSVSANSTGSNGGNIYIRAPGRIRLIESTVSTSAGGGGSGGNISLESSIVGLRNHTTLESTAVNGPGGTIAIRTNEYRKVNSTVDVSSQAGPDGSVIVLPLTTP